MASTSKGRIHKRIKNRVNRTFTTAQSSIIAWLKKHLQHKEGDDKPHQSLDTVDKTQSPAACAPPPSLLTIPLEIRLQIFGYLLRVDNGRICPHARVPYLFIHPDDLLYVYASNDIFLPALRINRQLYFEMKPILYSENLFYFDHCLTLDPFWFGFPQELIAAIGMNIRQIGFPLHSIESELGSTKEASIKAAERLKAEFKLLSIHMPNLNLTRVDLFFKYTRPCQRFLVCLVRSCQLLPGKKIITVHGSNREKERIANMLRIHLNGCSDILLLGGCICIPFLGMEWERYKVLIYTRETHRARADSLNLWVAEQSLSRRGKRAAFESVVKYGSVFLSYNPQVKGPRMGCLRCKLGTDCVHEAKYTPTRKEPVDRIGKVSIGAFEDWIEWKVKTRKSIRLGSSLTSHS